MAKMKQKDISGIINDAIKHLDTKLQLAIHKELAPKIGKTTAVTIEQQMRAKGVRRAKETGTHKMRLPDEQAKADRVGSILDVYYKIWRPRDGHMTKVMAGQTTAGYKARFVDQGFSNHHWWGQATGINVRGKGFIKAAEKIMDSQLPKLIDATVQKAMANPKKFKKKYRIK